ncbi:MAG: hypothetical protein D6718_02060 [Acidobacteria bacterium]|nr:MAG: hypothetical protein D6718_02060 [Acidobacteriota bacterium]
MSDRGRDRERLIEAVVSADRRLDPDGRIVPPAAFWDLSPQDREAAFFDQMLARALEAAWHPRGLSTTARRVVERSRRLEQLPPR